MSTGPRTEEAVCRRVRLARAARIAFPRLSQYQLAAKLGFNRGTFRLYVKGGIKCFRELPPWADPLFKACSALGHGDLKSAAAQFRELSNLLDTTNHV